MIYIHIIRQWHFWVLRQVDIFKSSFNDLDMSEDYISPLIWIIYNPIINYREQNLITNKCQRIQFFFLIFICSGFCHTLKWNSHGFTCVPHPDPPSHLPPHPLPLGFPIAPGPSTCLMHPTWAGDPFHPRYYTCFDAVLLKYTTLTFSHRVQKYICVSFSVLHIELSSPSF